MGSRMAFGGWSALAGLALASGCSSEPSYRQPERTVYVDRPVESREPKDLTLPYHIESGVYGPGNQDPPNC